MNKQPEALRLAEQLEDPANAKIYLAPYIAAELRRLHTANQTMQTALQFIVDNSVDGGTFNKTARDALISKALEPSPSPRVRGFGVSFHRQPTRKP